MRIRPDDPPPPPPPEPEPRKYGLRPQPAFEAINPPANSTAAGGPIDVGALHRAAASAPPKSLRGTPPRAFEANDVAPLLRAKAAAEHAAKQADPASLAPQRRSRRLRDYLILLVGANATIAALMLLAGPDPLTSIFGFSAMVVFTSGLTWVVFGVMDNY